jgi:DNA-binding response OmpR family regulator
MTRVLVIEDDRSVGAAIQMILTREGFEAVHTSDAEAGIKAFEASSFDLVIVDIFMPGKSGIDVIASFREREFKAPILAMTGFRFRESMDSGLDFLGMAANAGATICLNKPFTLEQLTAAIYASIEPEQRSDRDQTQRSLR